MTKNGEPKVLIVSPGAQFEIPFMAQAFYDFGIDYRLISTSLFSLDSNFVKFAMKYGMYKSFQQKVKKRIVPGGKEIIKTRFIYFEFLRTLLPNSVQGMVLRIRNLLFDIYSTVFILRHQEQFQVIVFQHHSGALAIKFAKKLNKHVILNISIAHHEWIEKENDIETRFNSFWSQYLQFSRISKFDRWILNGEINNAHSLIVASTFTKRSLQEYSIKLPIFVVPLGSSLTPTRGKSDVNKINDSFKIIVVGQLTQRKGLSYLLEAFENASLPHDSELIFAGRDSSGMGKSLLKFPRVKVLGHLNFFELQKLMESSNLFLCNSLIEGFSLVTLDAMKLGLPVIASDRTFGSDLIRHGENGFVVNPRDVVQITKLIEWIYLNPKKAKILARNGQEDASKFTWDSYERNFVSAVTKSWREFESQIN